MLKILIRIFLCVLIFSGGMALGQDKTFYVNVADSKVYVEEYGKGSAVLLLHAGNMDHRIWDSQIKALRDNHHVITLDIRGCGKTVDGDSTYLQSVALKLVLESLHIEKATLIGTSVGSVSATAFALDYPSHVEKLILTSPGLIGMELNRDPKLAMYNSQMADAYEAKDMKKYAALFVNAWVDGPLREPDQLNASVRQRALEIVTENVMRRKPGVHPGFTASPSQLQRLHELKIPILIIIGDQDMRDIKMSANEYRKIGATVMAVMGAGHLVNMEAPDEYNEIVMEFLKN